MKDQIKNSQPSFKNSIEHQGVVTKVTNRLVTVSLQGNVHCEACNAKSVCGTADSSQKEVEVVNTYGYQLNDQVNVLLRKDLGLKAVFWAYVFPFILVISVLVVSSFFVTEWLAGVLAIAVLLPYYFMLHLLKKVFNQSFQFSLVKTS